MRNHGAWSSVAPKSWTSGRLGCLLTNTYKALTVIKVINQRNKIAYPPCLSLDTLVRMQVPKYYVRNIKQKVNSEGGATDGHGRSLPSFFCRTPRPDSQTLVSSPPFKVRSMFYSFTSDENNDNRKTIAIKELTWEGVAPDTTTNGFHRLVRPPENETETRLNGTVDKLSI